MKNMTYDEAYYLYALVFLGFMDEFKFEVMQKVNSSRSTDEIYDELHTSFNDSEKLINLLAPKFKGHVHYSGEKSENLFDANYRLISYMHSLFNADKISEEEIAEDLKKITPVSKCYVFEVIGKCYSEVKSGRCDLQEFRRGMRSFLSKGSFKCQQWDVNLYVDRSDPDTALKLGSSAKPSMSQIDGLMKTCWPKEIRLIHCSGPTQMCFFRMEYRYLPSGYTIRIECERSVVNVYITNNEGKVFSPERIYQEANHCHYESNEEDLKQLIRLTYKAINEVAGRSAL